MGFIFYGSETVNSTSHSEPANMKALVGSLFKKDNNLQTQFEPLHFTLSLAVWLSDEILEIYASILTAETETSNLVDDFSWSKPMFWKQNSSISTRTRQSIRVKMSNQDRTNYHLMPHQYHRDWDLNKNEKIDIVKVSTYNLYNILAFV